MAADRSRLAAALAYKQAEEERRQRMMQSVPTTDNLPPVRPARSDLRTDLENLSSGIGQGVVNQLEGVKALVTDPVGTAKAAYEGVKGIVRDPSVLADALRYTAQKATSGPLGAGEVVGEMLGPMRGKGPMAEIDVYHGSPHRFEEFDASKIGTGEGAQAYGHGIYLAESPDVAKQYKKASDLTPEELEKQLKYALYKTETSNDPLVRDAFKNAAAQLKQSGGKQGSLYTADLPDEMVDRMLDWDKPLSEQPKLAEALRKNKVFVEYVERLMERPLAELDGKTLQRMAVGYAADKGMVGASGAADLLKNVGIPGIRYLDAGSRGQGGSGTRNFVVFPGEEKKVKILKRE